MGAFCFRTFDDVKPIVIWDDGSQPFEILPPGSTTTTTTTESTTTTTTVDPGASAPPAAVAAAAVTAVPTFSG